MSQCKTCGEPIDWCTQDGKWIPLEPIASHGDLDRSFVDEDGILRADHRDRHRRPAVVITRLDKKVKAKDAEHEQSFRQKVASVVGGKG